MFKDIIIFFILLILLLAVFYYTKRIKEGFDIPDTLQQYVNRLDLYTNDLSSSINLTGSSSIDTPSKVDSMRKTLIQTVAKENRGASKSAYDIDLESSYVVPDGIPSTLDTAKSCETAPKTCDAFDEPLFAQYCGMSFDINGMAADGSSHTGGLYVSSDDRRIYTKKMAKVAEKHIPPYDLYKVPQPTIGKASEGKFAITKDKCIIVKEKVDCAAKQTFGSPNCTQCFMSRDFSRVGPEIPRIPFDLLLVGSGGISIESPGNFISLGGQSLHPSNPITVQIPADSEGKTFTIKVWAQNTVTYVSGYITGETVHGPVKIDFNIMIQKDLETNAKQRMSGTKTINGFRCLSMVPGKGKTNLSLSCLVPFSFINAYDGDILGCDNGPVITQAASATFLESSPCFGKANQPGNYKLECLQERWIGLGGRTEGTGYPVSQQLADALQKPNGQVRDIDTIIDFLADKMTQAVTGTDANGNPLSIADWNALSMWGLGIPITSPCDGDNRNTGPVTKRCLKHLYLNRGAGNKDGATYSGSSDRASKNISTFVDYTLEGFATKDEEDASAELIASGSEPRIYNEIGGQFDPDTASGLSIGQNAGGVESYKRTLDEINAVANNNSLKNTNRIKQVKQVFNIDIQPTNSNTVFGKPQVFAVGPDYRYTKDQASSVCEKYGAQPASQSQLEEAYKNGADWCFTAYTSEGRGLYPITTSVRSGCANNQGIVGYDPGRAGILCYGPKPDMNSVSLNEILPFNEMSWDQPNKPRYLTVKGGYLETSGPQPACFGNVATDDAQQTCDSLGDSCTGFSYSVDGQGGGCYKGNFYAGKNNNGNYMGYVKVPKGPRRKIYGRYIKLQYDHQECLNLAQIMVYSKEGGPNIVKPTTIVQKPSGYQGDVFPNKNFVDGYGNTFVHTSCGDVPWIQIDLGANVPIYKVVIINRHDCCQHRVVGSYLQIITEKGTNVYTSQKIPSTNSIYTWYPPDTSIKLDVASDNIPPPPTQWAYGDNGTVSCNTYCAGTGGGPWNNEIPRSWNGANCVQTDPRIGGCNNLFTSYPGAGCLCQANGQGWR